MIAPVKRKKAENVRKNVFVFILLIVNIVFDPPDFSTELFIVTLGEMQDCLHLFRY